MNTTSIQAKVVRGVEKNRDNRRKIELQPRKKLMPFRAWLGRKNALTESDETDNRIDDTLLSFIPATVFGSERQEMIDLLAAAILRMKGDTTITAVSVIPEN